MIPASNPAHGALAPGLPPRREWTRVGGLAFALLLLARPVLAADAGLQVHGENSVFAGHGVALAWGVLKGATEEETLAILRIVPMGGPYTYVSVEGIDPFTGTRREILQGQPLLRPVDVRTPRATFADLPRREIHFYSDDGWHAGRPDLSVYFLGLPDTSPEFTSEPALLVYLNDALAKATGGR